MAAKKKKVEQEQPVLVKKQRPLRDEEVREKFRQYFVKLKRKMSLDQSMENILWLHLKSAGFNSPEKFDQGIENFGYKL